MSNQEVVDQIISMLGKHGGDAYFGEPVTQLEHALQSAYLAEQAGASDALVVAALLHDIGHLVHHESEDIANQGVDMQHEELGDTWLSQHFGKAVSEPARLHVAAKRYLCATDAGYLEALSPASQLSLRLQKGIFTAEEVADFETNLYFREALKLRRWDDQAKIPGLPVPGLAHYTGKILSSVKVSREL